MDESFEEEGAGRGRLLLNGCIFSVVFFLRVMGALGRCQDCLEELSEYGHLDMFLIW